MARSKELSGGTPFLTVPSSLWRHH